MGVCERIWVEKGCGCAHRVRSPVLFVRENGLMRFIGSGGSDCLIEVTARQNVDRYRGAAFGNCRKARHDCMAASRVGHLIERFPLAELMRLRSFFGLSNCTLHRLASSRSRAPRRDRT